ncbi:hypothetical protein ACPPVO_25665 [Dactylosporangium sp. McL0621]|uniref:hypothetical protein n=1 Tax=Dactylosporangium sp. McL0621 TaxID=3415678 RepID=UPI003CF459E1
MADTVHMSNVRGVLVGDDNVQNNHFGGAGPVDPEVLLRHVRELAPAHLEGRDAELAELAAFCRGAEACARWEAEPWAGKTALLATFVLHPPQDVDVLHFFVRAGESAWNDSRAFAASLHAQLVTHLGAQMSGTDDPGLFQSEVAVMLDRAAERADAAGRRLVLVVDGIDEDQSRNRTPVLPSIVTLLPAVPHPALRIILTGREQLDQATDLVDTDHPALRAQVRRLSGSAQAASIKRTARLEFDVMTRSGQLADDLLGFTVVSEGGIPLADIAALAEVREHLVRELLVTVGGRTLRSTGFPDGGEGLVFTHNDLREAAINGLGAAMIARYRARVAAWAATYRDRRWPGQTPFFLAARYGRMLADADDVDALTDLALDAARHGMQRRRLGGDGPALGEIGDAQRLWCRRDSPDLDRVARLARTRWELTRPNLYLPEHLPATWALLGRVPEAMAQVGAMDDGEHRAATERRLFAALLQRGDWARAAALTGSPEDLYVVALTMAERGLSDGDDLIAQAVAAGLTDAPIGYARTRGEDYARTLDPDLRDAALFQVVGGLAQRGELDEARRVAGGIRDEVFRAFGRLIVIDNGDGTINEGQYRRMSALAERNPYLREGFLATLSRCLARAGQIVPAWRIVSRALTEPDEPCLDLVGILADSGDFDNAENIARIAGTSGAGDLLCERYVDAGQTERALAFGRSLPDTTRQARAAAIIGAKLIARGDPRGRATLEDARSLALTTENRSLASVAILSARSGDFEATLRLLRLMPRDELISAVHPIAQGGHEVALRALELLDDPVERAEAALTLAEAAIARDRPELARQAVLLALQEQLTDAELAFDDPDFDPAGLDPDDLVNASELLARAAWLLVRAGAAQDARRVAAQAEAASRLGDDTEYADVKTGLLAIGLAWLGDLAAAEDAVLRITDHQPRIEATAVIAVIAAEQGEDEAAIRLAAGIQDDEAGGETLLAVTDLLAKAGRLHNASRAAQLLADGIGRAKALAAVAEAYATSDPEYAETLAHHGIALLTPQRDIALAEVAAALAAIMVRTGSPEQVAVVERRLPDGLQRALFHAELAARAGADHARKAQLLATELMDPRDRGLVYAQLVHAWGELGDGPMVRHMVDAAVDLARSAPARSDTWFSFALAYGIEALCRTGQPDRAERLVADAPPSPSGRMQVFLAATLARAGYADAAERVADACGDGHDPAWAWNRLEPAHTDVRDLALAEVSTALARDPDRALRIARRINAPAQRAGALAAIALDLFKRRRPVRARRVLTEAWSLGEWEAPLQVLAQIAPETARTVLAQP